ncbi:MAG: hypothetical protein AB7E76_09990 [Deferribacterales bacterium]
MDWVDSSHIRNWAGTRNAQDLLPLLIRKLIYASVDVKEIDIPAGSAVSTGGWDGIVLTEDEHPYVPTGMSVWEFGVSQDAKSKADSDYEKRVENPLGVEPTATHFRFVSPRAFNKNTEWADAKDKEQVWQSVKAYNASCLESWLNTCPSVAKWFASKIGLHSGDGTEALDSWWEKWSTATTPNISDKMVLAGRQAAVDSFKELIDKKRYVFSIEADSLDEGLAFIYCAAKSFDSNINLLSRALIVSSKSAYDNIVENYSNIILIPIFPEFEGGNYAISKGHSVIVPIGRVKNFRGDSIDLVRQDKSSFTEALEELGLDHSKAWRLAGDSKRSLTVFRRLQANGQFTPPRWLGFDKKELVPMLLLGAFDSNNDMDKQIVCEIYNKNYDYIEKVLSDFSEGDDPYVRRIGGVWELISFRDAWHFLSTEITEELKKGYHKAFLTVYSDENTKFQKVIEERYSVYSNEQYKYSSYLRDSLKQTFSLLAIEYDNQPYVDSILIELLNEDTSWELWASLRSEIDDFAESSPSVFLRSLKYLSNQNDKVQKLFEEPSNAFFGGHSFTGILWGLERLVWIDDYNEQAVLMLAELAKLDTNTESNYVNRPLKSLKEIFLYWHPQGNFTIEERINLVGKIYSIDENIAWKLIKEVLPERFGGTASGIAKPVWRDYRKTEVVTYGEAYSFANKLISFGLKIMNRCEHINIILEHADMVPDNLFIELVKSINALDINDFSLDERKSVWDSIEDIIVRCAQSDDDAIKQRDVQLKDLAKKFKPDDLAYAYSYLFDYDYHAVKRQYPDAKDWKEHDSELESDRLRALTEIYEQDGIDGLIRLISISKDTRHIGWIAGGNHSFHDGLDLYFADYSSSFSMPYKILYETYIRRRVYSEEGYLQKIFDNASVKNEVKTEVLLWCSRIEELFEYLSQLDSESCSTFWKKVYPYHLNETLDKDVVVEKYLSVGNAIAALEYVTGAKKKEEFDSSVLVKILFSLLENLPERQLGTMDTHYINEAFDELWQSTDVSEKDLLTLEWAYLRIWEKYRDDDKVPKTINRKIATDPNFFADLISFAFKPRNSKENNAEVSLAQAENAYHALDIWNMIPGQEEDSAIEFDKLMKWIHEAREICKANDRLEIGDQYIGHILAKSTNVKSYMMPEEAILRVLNENISKDVNIGFIIQLHNNKGTSWIDRKDPGKDDRAIANKCRIISKEIIIDYPKTSELYESIAKDYDKRAKYDSERHELDGY